MLKIAIIGCGKISDAHASQIQRIRGCKIVAACDREELMAEQFCQRFGIEQPYRGVEEMLDRARPDVVHITTPPQSHFPVAKQCLERGCNVYVEKPFTLNTQEAVDLIALAKEKNLKLTVGHDDQFRHAARRMRRMVQDGYLGGPPVHMESYYCYELVENSSYAKALLSDKEHWVRKLPGQLLQNVISHGVARIAEFMTSEAPQVVVHGFVSGPLRKMGEEQLVDEVRAVISDDNGTTAYFTFSSQMRPALHQFRIYGPRNGLVLDPDNETLIRLRGKPYKSYLQYFLSPLDFAKQYGANSLGNMRKFLANDFHMKSGMKFLMESFYLSITQNKPTPIPHREILLTSRIMDALFDQLGTCSASEQDAPLSPK